MVRLTPVNTGAYDALLGRTYAELGNDARTAHKCQGVGGGRTRTVASAVDVAARRRCCGLPLTLRRPVVEPHPHPLPMPLLLPDAVGPPVEADAADTR